MQGSNSSACGKVYCRNARLSCAPARPNYATFGAGYPPHQERIILMKTLVLAAFLTLSLGTGAANVHMSAYQPPTQNYHQNNWMAGGSD